jgi:hypothetical protein
MIEDKITVLISSCDSYSILWDDFEAFFKKNWQLDCEVILVSETLKNNSFKTIASGTNSWGLRNLEAIKQVKTELIFWILDDYFLCDPFSKENLTRYIDDFIKQKMDRLQLSPNGYKKQIYSFEEPNLASTPKFNYKKIESSSDYSISMQPSIWRKSYIRKVLKPEYSPWQFEVEGSKLNCSNNVYVDESIKFHPYFNAVRKKNVFNLTRLIKLIDKLIEKVFYNDLPFSYSRGYKKFIKTQKPK